MIISVTTIFVILVNYCIVVTKQNDRSIIQLK